MVLAQAYQTKMKMGYTLKYREIVDGIFLDRPNRFIAHVDVNGTVETVHVKNTGRCKELLLPGAAVRLEVSDNPKRKTKYDLVAVHKQELGWVNMDSQAPNKVVGEWLSKQEFDLVRPEFACPAQCSLSGRRQRHPCLYHRRNCRSLLRDAAGAEERNLEVLAGGSVGGV